MKRQVFQLACVAAISPFVSAGAGADDCIQITQQPTSVFTCPDGAAPFSVAVTGESPFMFFWQMETAPDTWVTLGNDPMPLSCGENGSSYVTAQPINSPNVSIRVHGCAGPFNIRVMITNACGSAISQSAIFSYCPSDFNCDHAVDLFDYLDFVDAFSRSDIRADFNADQVVDFFDYLDFVSAFRAGC